MGAEAHDVESRVDALSQAGRDVLAQLGGADAQFLDDALASGDIAKSDLDGAMAALAGERALQPAGLDTTKLSQANQHRLAALDEVISASRPMPATWQAIATDTAQVNTLLTALVAHDELVFRATSAGRESDWPTALGFLLQGASALDDARTARASLSAGNDIATLDALFNHYAAYDHALTDLYAALRDGAAVDSEQVKTLNDEVAQAEATLPADTNALKTLVTDAAGASIAQAVGSLETARGAVSQAVALLP
jgi:hypothetical protein